MPLIFNFRSEREKRLKIIKTSNVSKIFKTGKTQFHALKNISISIEKGETVAIIGKSGSGKSTLMHLLSLLDKPSEGQIEIFSQSSEKMTNKQINKFRNQSVGFVFQQFFLNPKHTVIDNIMLPLKISGMKKSYKNQLAIDALRKVGLLDRINSKAIDLSGGQKQRVCIARAIVNYPEIIFADEPTGNLDSINGKIIEDLLFSLNKHYGITLVIVTHDNEIAKRCSKIITIKDGEVKAGMDE